MLEIGNIYNMDCLEGIKQLPQDEKYCIITDPPFNIGYHYNTYSDRKSDDEYYKWLDDIIGGLPAVIIHYPESLYRLSAQIKRFPEKVISWVYNSNTAKQHRDIAFFGIKPDLNKVRQPYKDMKDKRNIANMAKGLGGGKNVRLDSRESGKEHIEKTLQWYHASVPNAIIHNG